MDIAIIGAGNVGRALATSFVRAGHSVTIASRDPEDAGTVAAATGARVANSQPRSGRHGRRPSSSSPSPFTSAPEIAAEIGEAVRGKIVVDATNRMSFGADGPDDRHDHLERRGARRPAARARASSRHSTRSSPRTRPTRSPRASSSTATSPATTRPPRRRSSSSSVRSASTRSTSARWRGRASSRASPS